MYMIEEGLGRRWRPMAVFFSVLVLVGTLCIMQSNQLTEAILTIVSSGEAIESSAFLSMIGGAIGCDNDMVIRILCGLVIGAIVAAVIFGGITRIGKISARMVPVMVVLYFLIVHTVILRITEFYSVL